MTNKTRELLERVLAGMDRYGDIYPETVEEIRTFLADTNPSETINSQEVDRSGTKQDEEPKVAAILPNGVRVTNVHDAYIAGLFEGSELAKLKAGQDEEPVAWMVPSHNGGMRCYWKPREDGIPAYLHPAPRKPFVRLSEEEMKACEPQLGIVKTPDGAKVDGLWIYDFARAIEDALEEKNK